MMKILHRMRVRRVRCPKNRNFRNLGFFGQKTRSGHQKIGNFEISGFLVKKPGLATKKSENSKFRVFWSKNQVWPPKNVNFQNLGFLEPMALAFFEKIILSLTFLPATPSAPSRTLEGLFELTRRPSRALDSPRALLPERKRKRGKDTGSKSLFWGAFGPGGPSAPQKMDLLY